MDTSSTTVPPTSSRTFAVTPLRPVSPPPRATLRPYRQREEWGCPRDVALDRGGNGLVYSCAVYDQHVWKRYRGTTAADGLATDCVRELAALQHLPEHRSVIALLGVGKDDRDMPCTILPRYSMSVFTFIRTRCMTSALTRAWHDDASDGLRHLHAHGVLHRDVKAANVLLRTTDTRLEAVLCDFGSSLIVRTADVHSPYGLTDERDVTTILYACPDVLHGRAYDTRVDWWALGLLCLEMVERKVPYTDLYDNDEAILRRRVLELVDGDAFASRRKAAFAEEYAAWNDYFAPRHELWRGGFVAVPDRLECDEGGAPLVDYPYDPAWESEGAQRRAHQALLRLSRRFYGPRHRSATHAARTLECLVRTLHNARYPAVRTRRRALTVAAFSLAVKLFEHDALEVRDALRFLYGDDFASMVSVADVVRVEFEYAFAFTELYVRRARDVLPMDAEGTDTTSDTAKACAQSTSDADDEAHVPLATIA